MTNARWVMTPTPTGTKSSDKWVNRMSAAAATGSRTVAEAKAGNNSTSPTTGPGERPAECVGQRLAGGLQQQQNGKASDRNHRASLRAACKVPNLSA